ncbi:MAG: zinc-dependent metalloprotease, partial [Pedobacter sp.]|nr:zinc-dependent metalloprotease [Pedobacter sp.]
EVIAQFNRYMGHVATNVGGLSENFKNYEQSGPVYAYLPKATQQDALSFFNKNLFVTPLWLINTEELRKFDNGTLLNRIKSVQTNTLGSLLSPTRIARLLDNSTKNGASKAYTLTDMFSALNTSVFSSGRPDDFKRNLQRAYVEDLGNLMTKDFDLPGSLSADAAASYGYTPINVGLSDIRPLVRMELKSLLADTKSRANAGDAISKAHYNDLSVRIKDILDPKK